MRDANLAPDLFALGNQAAQLAADFAHQQEVTTALQRLVSAERQDTLKARGVLEEILEVIELYRAGLGRRPLQHFERIESLAKEGLK